MGIRQRLWGAVAVASLVAIVAPFAAGGVGGTQSSTAATEQQPATKPVAKAKANSSTKTPSGGSKSAGSGVSAGSGTTSKGKSAAASKSHAGTVVSHKPTAQTSSATPLA